MKRDGGFFMKKALLSLFVCAAILVTMFPIAVFAASGTVEDPIRLELGKTEYFNREQDPYIYCSFIPEKSGAYTVISDTYVPNDKQPLFGVANAASGYLEAGNTYIIRIYSQTEWVQVIDEGRHYTGYKDDNNNLEYLIWDFDPDEGKLTIDPGVGCGEMMPVAGDRYVFPWYSVEDRIEHVVIGEGVTSVADYAFCSFGSFYEQGDRYTSLISVSFPSTLKTIGKEAFRQCPSLKTLSFPASLESIEYDAFFHCEALESVTFNGATAVGYSAFYGCTALEEVAVNDPNMKHFGPFSFFNTPWIRNLASDNKGAAVVNNVLIGAYQAWDKEEGDGILIIPDGVTTISEAALHGTSLFTAGGEEDFQYVWYLEEVVIPDSVTNIEVGEMGFGAFALCDQLERVTIGNGLKTIPRNCFEGCGELRTVKFGKNVTTIEDYAFDDCWLPGDLVIPDTVTTIGKYAFRLESVKGGWDWVHTVFDDDDKEYKEKDFTDQHIVIGPAAAEIARNAFKGWDNENVPIKGYTGTYAEKWASENDFMFESIGSFFKDVPSGAWYTAAAAWCSEHGYITGTGNGMFSPDMTLTRAMFVQILARIAIGNDLDTYTYKGKFNDVRSEDWFARAVQWAVDNGITSGIGDNTFSPNTPVTREQLATFFLAYARSEGYDVSASTDLEKYTDAGQISSWAVNAIKWAVAEGLISGTSETTVSPQMSATRAQAAVIFRKFIEIYAAKQK